MVSIFRSVVGIAFLLCRILRLRRDLEATLLVLVFVPLRKPLDGGVERCSFETTGIRFRLLAGESARLRVLPVSSCGQYHRTVAKLWNH